jgi:23S rRNA pseudouridine2605 synthase
MENERGGIRLQKFLATCGVASRRKCEELIAEGHISINGAVVTEMGVRVQPGDTVAVDGKPVAVEEKKVYIAFYKPPYVVTTASDPEGRKTALDFFQDFEYRVYPVGRLDYETEGLLLMTNDGEWANRITHPSFNLDKEYLVKVNGIVEDAQIRTMENGVMLEGKRTWPARIVDVRRGGMITQLNVVIHEGRNRQVRRMLEAVGKEVVFLKRVRVGSVLVGDLKPGQWRNLSEEEVASLSRGQ